MLILLLDGWCKNNSESTEVGKRDLEYVMTGLKMVKAQEAMYVFIDSTVGAAIHFLSSSGPSRFKCVFLPRTMWPYSSSNVYSDIMTALVSHPKWCTDEPPTASRTATKRQSDFHFDTPPVSPADRPTITQPPFAMYGGHSDIMHTWIDQWQNGSMTQPSNGGPYTERSPPVGDNGSSEQSALMLDHQLPHRPDCDLFGAYPAEGIPSIMDPLWSTLPTSLR